MPKWQVVPKARGFNIDKVETGDRLTIEGTNPACEKLANRVCALLNSSEPLTLDAAFSEYESEQERKNKPV